jgi:hypothetical protein
MMLGMSSKRRGTLAMFSEGDSLLLDSSNGWLPVVSLGLLRLRLVANV